MKKNNYFKPNFIHLTIITILFVYSCKLFCDEDISQNYDNLREITHWTVDTLDYPGVEDMNLRKMWGSSVDDLYVVGSSSEGIIGAIWHYDGNEWSPVPLDSFQGGYNHGLIWVRDIWGFSKNDVYIVGVKWTQADDSSVVDSCFVVHYNGTDWKEIKVDNFGMNAIGGTGPNDIWLGGIFKGNLSHYDGKKWINYNDMFPEELYYGIPNFENITRSKYNKTYAIVNNYNVFPYLVSTEGTEWKIEHTFDEVNYYKLHHREDGTLYTYGFFEIPISIWNGGQWQPFFVEENFSASSIFGLNNDNLLITGVIRISEKNENNIIVHHSTYKLYHYNGTDFFSFDALDLQKAPYSVWSDGNEIFIASQVVFFNEENKPHKTTIIHGR